MKPAVSNIEQWPLERISAFEGNARVHGEEQVVQIARSIESFGFNNPLLVDPDGLLIAGHGRFEAAKYLKLETVPVIMLSHLSEAERRAYTLADNKISLNSSWSMEKLELELSQLKDLDLDLSLLGFAPLELQQITGLNMEDQFGNKTEESYSMEDEAPKKLSDSFLVPPFSVLDARQGYWKERKKQWLQLGIQSEVGRGENLLKMSDTVLEPDAEKRALQGTPSNPEMIPGYYAKIRNGMSKEEIIAEHEESGSTMTSGTSIFDPLLCELAYRWFSPKHATVLDPFAGGSVRGIVASKLGRNYFGCDLREEQVAANEEQARGICKEHEPKWVTGDSREIRSHFPKLEADFIFSCPPYADLEVYSDDPQDLSTLGYEDFVKAYADIINQAVSMLKPDRFACFVVGEVREKSGGGFYRNFVSDTIQAFERAGARFYNEIVLMTSAGTLALRAGRVFTASRKIGKTHQNVLVFCKGDPFKAVKACGEVEVFLPAGMEEYQPETAELPESDNELLIGGAL